MKLYTRTYFHFLLIILLTSLTLFIFILGFFEQSNTQEARAALKNGGDRIAMNYNNYKRGLWTYLAKLNNDQELADRFSMEENWDTQKITEHLLDQIRPNEVDYVILQSETFFSILSISALMEPVEEFYSISRSRWHPTLEIHNFGSSLFLIGSLTLFSEEGSKLNIFLVKAMDRQFTESLTYNTTAELLITSAERVVMGTLAAHSLPLHLPLEDAGWNHLEFFNVEHSGSTYDVTVRRQDTIGKERRDLLFITFLSNSIYHDRIQRLTGRILMAVIISSIISLFISTFFARSITLPIKTIAEGLTRVRKGDFRISLGTRGCTELKQLQRGFNKMAGDLLRDKLAQEQYIQEITYLHDYNEKIIESLGAALSIINRDLSIEKANMTFQSYFGLSPSAGPPWNLDHVCFDEPLLQMIREILDTTQTFHTTTRRVYGDRLYHIRLYCLQGSPADTEIRCLMTAEDITYRSQLEEKIFQAEKLSSLSILSAGVAHEINNPLSTILTNVQNLLAVETQDDQREALKWVEQETRRIGRIIRDLLDFADKPEIRNTPCHPFSLIQQVVRFMRFSVGREKSIDFIIEAPFKDPEALSAAISADELKQVLINLLQNGVQAIGSEGSITISLFIDDDDLFITIKDSGSGMDGMTLRRLFDPFYTTKQDKGGTGLGLSIVYGILNKNDGSISVESTVGEGTAFTLSIPRSTK